MITHIAFLSREESIRIAIGLEVSILLIDELESQARKMIDDVFANDKISRYICEKSDNPLVVPLLQSFSHNMKIQRYSHKKTS